MIILEYSESAYTLLCKRVKNKIIVTHLTDPDLDEAIETITMWSDIFLTPYMLDNYQEYKLYKFTKR